MVKKICINIVIVSSFVILCAAVILPFSAEMQFNAGKEFERDYRWKAADAKFDLAGRLDPLSAEYRRDIGKLHRERAAILKNKAPVLLEAESEYEKSHKLNPYSARYLMELAAVEAELFLFDNSKFSDRVNDSIRHFKEALERDPNNYIFNYDAAHNLLCIWNYLSGEERQFILNQFRYFLELDMGYHWHIYPALWKRLNNFDLMLQATPAGLKHYKRLYDFLRKNEIWEYRKAVAGLLNGCRAIEEPRLLEEEKADKLRRIAKIKDEYAKEKDISASLGSEEGFPALTDWHGVTDDEKNTYVKGNMYWPGTVNRLVYLPPAAKNIVIKAAGSEADGIGPYMIVELEGEEIGETFVDSTGWKDYSFPVSGCGSKVLSVSFVNDGGNIRKGEDRNLYVGDVRVE